MVLAVVLLNAIIGYVQEGRAERALEAIRGMIDPRATVIREGRRTAIAAEDIVPGDLVLLEPGDRVPADLRLVRTRNLRIDEAALTGESVPVDKCDRACRGDGAARRQGIDGLLRHLRRERKRGGRRGGAPGSASQLGRISTLVGTIETLTTPLLRQMDRARSQAHASSFSWSAPQCSPSRCWCAAITGRKRSW